MRVLHVLGELNHGGIESFLMNIYRHIDKTTIQFDFVIHTPKKCLYEEEIEQLGGRIFRVPRFYGINYLSYVKSWHKLFSEHSSFIAVHGHIGSSAAYYLSVAKKYGITTIAHSHGTRPQLNAKGLLYMLFSYQTRFVADWFFACSKAAARARYGKRILTSPQFKLIHNAIDIKRFLFSQQKREEMRKEFNLSDNLVVGHVGRFSPVKNHSFLIDIFVEVLQREPRAILMLVGDGETKSAIEEKVTSLGIQENVICTGARNDIPDLLSAMDVFVLPSFSEGLGISLIEAQVSGLHSIASHRVPWEVKVTPLVQFQSLKESAQQWAQEILAYSDLDQRTSMESEVRAAGYDIFTLSESLKNFYLSLPQEPKEG